MTKLAQLLLLIAVLIWLLGLAIAWDEFVLLAKNDRLTQVMLATILMFLGVTINECLGRRKS